MLFVIPDAQLPQLNNEVLGLTWTALMLFAGGALGGFCRAALSETQKTRSKRTFVDCMLGGVIGVLLPVFGPKIITIIDIDVNKLTSLHQSGIAFLIGYGGTAAVTSLLWRFGIIKPQQGPLKFKEEPRTGVFYNTDKDKEG